MVLDKKIHGKYVTLRSVNEDDAEITMQLRQNKDKTRFLHHVDSDIKQQLRWIKEQMEREGDYFFAVIDQSEAVIGTMGIYEIEGDKGHIGRLLMYGNAIQSYEAYLLLICFGFETLGLRELYGDTDINNTTAMRFSQMFGFQYKKPVYDEELNRDVCYCSLIEKDFELCRKKLDRMIYR